MMCQFNLQLTDQISETGARGNKCRVVCNKCVSVARTCVITNYSVLVLYNNYTSRDQVASMSSSLHSRNQQILIRDGVDANIRHLCWR